MNGHTVVLCENRAQLLFWLNWSIFFHWFRFNPGIIAMRRKKKQKLSHTHWIAVHNYIIQNIPFHRILIPIPFISVFSHHTQVCGSCSTHRMNAPLCMVLCTPVCVPYSDYRWPVCWLLYSVACSFTNCWATNAKRCIGNNWSCVVDRRCMLDHKGRHRRHSLTVHRSLARRAMVHVAVANNVTRIVRLCSRRTRGMVGMVVSGRQLLARQAISTHRIRVAMSIC